MVCAFKSGLVAVEVGEGARVVAEGSEGEALAAGFLVDLRTWCRGISAWSSISLFIKEFSMCQARWRRHLAKAISLMMRCSKGVSGWNSWMVSVEECVPGFGVFVLEDEELVAVQAVFRALREDMAFPSGVLGIYWSPCFIILAAD